MDKRKFLKISATGGLATVVNAGSNWKGKAIRPDSSTFKPGFYMWTNPDHRDEVNDIRARYQNLASKGIRGILFENDSPDQFKEDFILEKRHSKTIFGPIHFTEPFQISHPIRIGE